MADDDTQRYHCSYCGCDITLRLKCAECTDFDLCLHCFSSGAVAGPHRKDHSYQLIDEGSFPLLVDDWGAIEEVLLLDAVEQDGFGNWEDIAAHVVTKTARESRDHYGKAYIGGVIGEGTIPPNYHASVLEGRGGEARPPSPHFTHVQLEHAEQLELGYLPLRDDFEREYNNDAETLISCLTVDPADDELETQLKLAHVDMYSREVMEREEKKRIAKHHSLIAGKQRLSAYKRKLSKEERDLRARYKLLARLLDQEDYEQLINSMKQERLLRHKIRQLKRYRKNGITRLDDCAEFDMLRTEQQKLSENTTEDADGSPCEDEDADLVLASELTLLSATERKFCHSLALKPHDYLRIKTEVLKTSALKRTGYVVRSKLPKTLSSDQKAKLVQFFQKSGWAS